jgi:hypothetical protein
MSKMGSHCSFETQVTAKRRAGSQNRESDCQFDSRPEKVGNRPDLLGFRRRVTYRWKALDKSYNFAADRVAIRGLLAKLCGFKVAGVLAGAVSGLPGVPGQKGHFDVGPVERCRVNPIRGGRQQPLQSLEKLRKYKGGRRRHEVAASPSPKIWP